MREKIELTARDKDLLIESLSHLTHLQSCVTKLEYTGDYNATIEDSIVESIKHIQFCLTQKLIIEI